MPPSLRFSTRLRRAFAAAGVLPALATGTAAWSAPLVDACPPQLAVKQSVSQDVPGWTAVDPQESYPFARVVFYKGAPSDDVRVVPTAEYRTAAGLHDVWKLPPEAAGHWLACQYGNTTAQITRKLDGDVDTCRADYDGRFATLIVKTWTCFDSKAPPPRPASSPSPAPTSKLAPHGVGTARAPKRATATMPPGTGSGDAN